MKEIWKDIKGYEKYYQVSNLGRVKSKRRIILRSDGVSYSIKGRILKPYKNQKTGYEQVTLGVSGMKEKFYVHRLVAQSFLNYDPKSGMTIDHLDFDKSNNKDTNLEVTTMIENLNRAYEAKRAKKYKTIIYDCQTKESKVFYSTRDAARKLGIGRTKLRNYSKSKEKLFDRYIVIIDEERLLG